MRVELTDGELATVRRFIKRRERWVRQWKFCKWLAPVVCAMIFAVAVQNFLLAQQFYWHGFGGLHDLSNEAKATGPVTQADIEIVRSEAVLSSVMCSTCNTMAFFYALLGTFLVVFTLANWNRHKQLVVLVKILRFLTEERAEPS